MLPESHHQITATARPDPMEISKVLSGKCRYTSSISELISWDSDMNIGAITPHSLICERCLQQLPANNTNVLFGTKTYHRQCFRCFVCLKQLEVAATIATNHTQIGPLCEEHLRQLEASGALTDMFYIILAFLSLLTGVSSCKCWFSLPVNKWKKWT